MKIVIALGGNALGKTLSEQMKAVRTTASAIADLIEDGHEVVISHGNGPQVGMIQNAFAAYRKAEPSADVMPLSVCVAMSQGYIGYDLQNALGEELDRRGINIHVATVLTQVAVDPQDPAFQNPTKPIGAFMTAAEAKKFAAETGAHVAEDAGRGWRQVVASPRPQEIIEIATIRALLDGGHAVIAAGGGGIPVIWKDRYRLKGVPAVIDKDFASECLAEQIGADLLIILTAVEKAAIHFGKPNQQWLGEVSAAEARRFVAEGHFAPGSMRPKMEAAILFAESAPGRTALITLLGKARDGIAGRTGTRVTAI
jgi:carbamate kinase